MPEVRRLPEQQRCVKNSYTLEEICDSGAGRLIHEESPRFPSGNMRMVDEITTITSDGGDYGNGYAEGILNLDPDQWFFNCHFLGDPVMPGCLGLDALWQLTGFYMSWQGYLGTARALGVKHLRFKNHIIPTNKVVKYKIHVKRVRERPLATISACGELWVDDVLAYIATDMAVGIVPRQPLNK